MDRDTGRSEGLRLRRDGLGRRGAGRHQRHERPGHRGRAVVVNEARPREERPGGFRGGSGGGGGGGGGGYGGGGTAAVAVCPAVAAVAAAVAPGGGGYGGGGGGGSGGGGGYGGGGGGRSGYLKHDSFDEGRMRRHPPFSLKGPNSTETLANSSRSRVHGAPGANRSLCRLRPMLALRPTPKRRMATGLATRPRLSSGGTASPLP